VRPRLESLLVCSVLLLSVAALTGCGESNATSTAHLPPRDGDYDIDSLGQGRYDADKDANPTYGPYANPKEHSAIVSLIKHYYAVAAVDDGAQACSMLYPLVAEAAVEEHHPGKGPLPLRGNTCSQIVSKILAEHHRELVEDLAMLRVGWIQLQARQAVALVHFGPDRERVIRVHRVHGGWQMNALIDSGPL
jgi:hypothetical protein